MNDSRTHWLHADLGEVPYRIAHRLQLGLVEARRSNRIPLNLILLLEHPTVFTLGKRCGRDHLRVSETHLRERGIEVVPVERGGEITCHNPGQLIGYLILNLKISGIDIRQLVRSIEEVMIRTAADHGIPAGRDPRNTGVWVGGRKLGSIGLAVRQGITSHGFALNVANSLEPFEWIDPCGLEGVSMTTLSRETGSFADIRTVRERVALHIRDLFGVSLRPIEPLTLLDLAGITAAE